MTPKDIDLSVLERAIASLEAALAAPLNDLSRDASIQRFEYTFELTWKLLRRYFALQSREESLSIKDVFRRAAKEGFVDSADVWFAYLEARNRTVHTYSAATADAVFSVIPAFCKAAREVHDKLQAAISE